MIPQLVGTFILLAMLGAYLAGWHAASLAVGLMSLVLAYFVAEEILKKFKDFFWFTSGSPFLATWKYPGAKNMGIERGMRTIVVRHREGKPFRFLIAFRFNLATHGVLVDWYGKVLSDINGVAAFRTFLGTNPTEFCMLLDCPAEVNISSTEGDQSQQPTAAFPPHWYQKLGFFG